MNLLNSAMMVVLENVINTMTPYLASNSVSRFFALFCHDRSAYSISDLD